MEDLEIFTPTPRKITVAGTEFAILPLRMRHVAPFTKAIGPVIGLILQQNYVQAAMADGDAVVAAVAIATGASPEFLADLYPDAFMALAGAVFEVNLDFFAKAVLPAWTATMVRLAEVTGPVGAMSSPGLGAAATALPPASI